MQLAPLRNIAKDAKTKPAKLEAEPAAIGARLANPALYAKGKPVEITAANTRLEGIAREAAATEEAWLEADAALKGTG